MHIYLKNKKIIFNNYKVKCSIGKRGISVNKKEGDYITPKGTFKLVSVFYRKDRVKNIDTSLKKFIITKKMGWCDDAESKYYNKLIRFPFKGSAEKLYLKKNIYDIIIIIDYNFKPIVKHKGSAIFLHIATRNYRPTKGCVAISKKNLVKLLKLINNRSKITIN